MSFRRLLATGTFAVLIASAAPVTLASAQSGHADAKYKHYANCTKMHKDYPHGVGRVDAVDKTSHHAPKVTNFYRSDGLYNANRASDRDHDGIACEQH